MRKPRGELFVRISLERSDEAFIHAFARLMAALDMIDQWELWELEGGSEAVEAHAELKRIMQGGNPLHFERTDG